MKDIKDTFEDYVKQLSENNIKLNPAQEDRLYGIFARHEALTGKTMDCDLLKMNILFVL